MTRSRIRPGMIKASYQAQKLNIRLDISEFSGADRGSHLAMSVWMPFEGETPECGFDLFFG